MSAIFGIPSLLKKDDFLLNTPVYINRVLCEMPYTNDIGLASLHQHQFIEISCVLKGVGIHRVWNETYPVSAGGSVCVEHRGSARLFRAGGKRTAVKGG